MNGSSATATAAATGPMVRIIANGIPYYTDTANRAYMYGIDSPNQPRIQIGNYDPIKETVQLSVGWTELFEPKIAAYRLSQSTQRLRNDPAGKPQRTRKSTVSKKKESS